MSTFEEICLDGSFAADIGQFRQDRLQADLFQRAAAGPGAYRIEKAEGHDPEVEELLAYIAPLLAIEFYEEVRGRVSAIEQAIINVPFPVRVQMNEGVRLYWARDLVAALLAGLLGYTTPRGRRAIVGGAQYLAAGGGVALSPAAGTPEQILDILRVRPAATLGALKDYGTLLNDSVTARIGETSRAIAEEMLSVAPDASRIIRPIAGDSSINVVVGALDQWAYRWRNVGAAVVAAQTGKSLVAFNNPPFGPDQRTSTFCRWVHLRPLDPVAVTQQVEAAGPSRSKGSIQRAWPFVGNFRTTDGPDEFQARVLGLMRHGIGLPPYHFGCRTQVRVAA